MDFHTIAGKTAALSALLAGSLAAQTMGPPPFMQIFREQVKFGRLGSHVQAEAGWPRAFAKAKIPNNYVAFTTVYGPNEAWFVEGHGSLAELDAANHAISAAPGLEAELDRYSQADAANVSGSDALLLRYVPEASNDADVNPADMRVWEVTIFRVRPGKEASFFEGAKLFQSVVKQANAKAPWAAYEVMAGMVGPTYLVFSPHKTLEEMDPNTGNGPAIQRQMSEEIQKRFATLSEGFVSVQNLVLVPSPEMSYPPEAWVTHDPKFWGKKPAPAKPAAAKPVP